MPSVTFNFTAAQDARIQEATAVHNKQTGESLSTKEWLFNACIKPVVHSVLNTDAGQQARATSQTDVEADLGTTVG